MSDETKPYQGAKGPRKTKPRVRPDVENVRQLFGDEVAQGTEERLEAASHPPMKGPGRVEGLTDKQRRRGKIRVGRKITHLIDRMEREGLTMAQVVRELSPEELARGQLKNINGSFGGPPSKWVPAEFHKECVRELIRRGKVLYQENYIEAIKAMTLIASNPAVEPKDRIKAAQFVIERIEGKVPDKLEVGISEPWQEMLFGVVATVPGDAPVRILSAEQGDAG